MSNFPQLSFAGMQDYAPYEGGGHGFVAQEGLYKVKIDAVDPGMTKDGTKGKVKVGMVVQDQDSQGVHLLDDVLYSGMDKNGDPLVRQFCDFLVSTGTPESNIQQFGAQGTAMSIEDAIGQLVGRDAYVEIKFETYQGELKSRIANWVTPQRYAKAVETGGHRGRKAEHMAQTAQPAVGQVNLGGQSAAAAAPAAGIATPAAGNAAAAPGIPNL